MNKMITYCYVDGQGSEQVGDMKEVLEGQKVGYAIDEVTARIWISGPTGDETITFPLDRIVFIRETIE